MKAKWMAALAALSLTTTPALANPARALAPVSQASQVGGESFVPWAILVGMLVGATLLVINEEDNDNDNPASP